jgi:hypothetical protein
MSATRIIRLAGAVLALALVLALAPAASAQCAMCANAAAAQQAEARRALNLGIAALAMPVMLLAGGFVFLSYKRRNPPDDPSGEFPGFKPETRRGDVVELPLDPPSEPPHSSAQPSQ